MAETVRAREPRSGTKDIPNANQKKMPAAFFVEQKPGNASWNAFDLSSSPWSACGSFSAFLHPAWVNADIVTMKLFDEMS